MAWPAAGAPKSGGLLGIMKQKTLKVPEEPMGQPAMPMAPALGGLLKKKLIPANSSETRPGKSLAARLTGK